MLTAETAAAAAAEAGVLPLCTEGCAVPPAGVWPSPAGTIRFFSDETRRSGGTPPSAEHRVRSLSDSVAVDVDDGVRECCAAALGLGALAPAEHKAQRGTNRVQREHIQCT